MQERLVKEIAPKLENRVSGFTTMVRVRVREGDRATLVKMSLIGNEQLKPIEKKKVASDKVQVTDEKIKDKEVKKSSEKKESTKLPVKTTKSVKKNNLKSSKK